MLAAILLNLPDYQKKRDADASFMQDRRNFKKRINEFAELLDESEIKPLRQLKQRVVKYAEDKATLSESSELLRELSMREFELRQSAFQSNQQDSYTVLILEHLTFILSYMQEQEEEILLLLME